MSIYAEAPVGAADRLEDPEALPHSNVSPDKRSGLWAVVLMGFKPFPIGRSGSAPIAHATNQSRPRVRGRGHLHRHPIIARYAW